MGPGRKGQKWLHSFQNEFTAITRPGPMSASVSVVPFEARHAGSFRAINLAWIETLFEVEPHDVATLSDPGALIAAGGHILVAVDTSAVTSRAGDPTVPTPRQEWRGGYVNLCLMHI